MRKAYPYNPPPPVRAPVPPGAVPPRAGPLPSPQALNGRLQRMVALPTGTRAPGMAQAAPVARPVQIPMGLGLDRADEQRWSAFLREAVPAAPDELNLRQSVSARMMVERTPADAGRAILERSIAHWRARRLGKSEGAMDTVLAYDMSDQELPAQDAWVSCRQAFFRDIVKPSRPEGFRLTDMRQLVLTYGPEILADILDPYLSSGALGFDGERFHWSDPRYQAIRGEPDLNRSMALVWEERR